MKVSFPTNGNSGLTEQLGQHFGRVPTYTIIDTETDDVTIINNTSSHMGGTKLPPEILADEGVNVMVCRGLGRRAVQLFEQLGIMVYVGAQGTVQDAYQAWQDETLAVATDENACRAHAFHGKGDGHGHRHTH